MKLRIAALMGAICPIVAGCEPPSNSPSQYSSPYSSQPVSAAGALNPGPAPTPGHPAPVPASNVTPVSASPPTVVRLSGIPLPANNSIDLDHTIILGSDSEWLGRVLFTTPMTVDQVVDFYRREMPHHGWTEFAATRSTTTILAFQADTRVATIQLTSEGSNQSPSGTRVEFWSTPRPAGAGTPVAQKTEQTTVDQPKIDPQKADQPNMDQQKADAPKADPQKTDRPNAAPDASSVPKNLLQAGGITPTAAAPPPRPPVDETLLPP